MITQQFSEDEVEEFVDYIFADKKQRLFQHLIYIFGEVSIIFLLYVAYNLGHIFLFVLGIPVLLILTMLLLTSWNNKERILNRYRKILTKERQIQIGENNIIINGKTNFYAPAIKYVIKYKNYIYLAGRQGLKMMVTILKKDEQLDIFIQNTNPIRTSFKMSDKTRKKVIILLIVIVLNELFLVLYFLK